MLSEHCMGLDWYTSQVLLAQSRNGLPGLCMPFPSSGLNNNRGFNGAGWGYIDPWGLVWLRWGPQLWFDTISTPRHGLWFTCFSSTREMPYGYFTAFFLHVTEKTWHFLSQFAMYWSTCTPGWGHPGAPLHHVPTTGHSRPQSCGC